jgi:hypothetical protein
VYSSERLRESTTPSRLWALVAWSCGLITGCTVDDRALRVSDLEADDGGETGPGGAPPLATAGQGKLPSSLDAGEPGAATPLDELMARDGAVPTPILLPVGRVRSSPTLVNFGPVAEGFGAPATITLSNDGAADLAAPELLVGGPGREYFNIDQNACSQPLPAGEQCRVRLVFQPTRPGDREALLIVDAGSRLLVGLFAQVVEPGALILSAAPDGSSDFGTVAVGASRVQTFRLTNPGPIPTGQLSYSLNSVAFDFADPTPDECTASGAALAPGASCDLRVVLVPYEEGATEATLTVISSDAGSVSFNVVGNAAGQ